VVRIADPEDPSKGFIIVKVPGSDARPHMSLAPDHCKYFQRVMDTTRPMVDFQVRDMLRVKIAPRLLVGYFFKQVASGASNTFALVLTLYNDSQYSAYNSFLIFERSTEHRDFKKLVNGFVELPQTGTGRYGFQATDRTLVHPGLEVEAAAMEFEAQKRKEADPRINIISGQQYTYIADMYPLVVNCWVGCENTAMREVSIIIDPKLFKETVVNDWKITRGPKYY